MENAINKPFSLKIEGNTFSFTSSKEFSEEIKICILTDSDACKNYKQNAVKGGKVNTTITFNTELGASNCLKLGSVNKAFKRELRKMNDLSIW